MTTPEGTKIGPIHLSQLAEAGVANFVMNRTWALTIILCCLIITGGFAWTASSHADTMQGYATKEDVVHAVEAERAVYASALKELKESLARIEQRLFDLASKTK